MSVIADAIWTLETFGRIRAVADSRVGPWIQIDHDREHTAKLVEAVAVLEAVGMAERHPTRGNPRNVRILKWEESVAIPKTVEHHPV